MDFIFNAFSAWNSLGLFFMALVFLLIGGGLSFYELMWRVKGRRVKGRIKELRVVGKVKDDDEYIKAHNTSVPDKDELKGGTKGERKKNFVGGGTNVVFLVMILALPLFFTGMGVHMGYKYYSLTHYGERANAKVIRNDSSYDSDNGTTYKAVLAFHDHNGRRYEVKDTISYGNSPSYAVGTSIGVYYDADNPEKFVIDDFWHNMALSIAFVSVVPVFYGFFVFISIMQKRQKDVGGRSVPSKGAARYSSETYYAVYEYQLPNGERAEHVSGWGSNMIGKNIPGRDITVFVSSRNPEKMKRPSMVAIIFGLIFLLPGGLIMHQAIQTVEFNYMMVVLPLALFGFIAFKISRFISKIPKDEFKKGMAEFRKAGFSVSSSSGANARALTTSEVRERMRAYVKNYKVGGYICLLIASGLAGGAYYTGNDMVEKLAVGVSARGEVVDFERKHSRTSDGNGYTYYSVVKYIDANGQTIKFKDRVGSSHRMHKRGDEVDVLYKPDDSQDAMIDRGIWNWLISGGLALGAFLMMLAGLDNMRTARLYNGGFRSRI